MGRLRVGIVEGEIAHGTCSTYALIMGASTQRGGKATELNCMPMSLHPAEKFTCALPLKNFTPCYHLLVHMYLCRFRAYILCGAQT